MQPHPVAQRGWAGKQGHGGRMLEGQKDVATIFHDDLGAQRGQLLPHPARQAPATAAMAPTPAAAAASIISRTTAGAKGSPGQGVRAVRKPGWPGM